MSQVLIESNCATATTSLVKLENNNTTNKSHSTIQSTTPLTPIRRQIPTRLKCDSHSNCTVHRSFSFDSYCCEWPTTTTSRHHSNSSSTNHTMSCCNWLEYMATYDKTTSRLPYKSTPTLLTVMSLLIGFIAVSFLLYCGLVSCCYCFRFGFFKRPRVVLVSGTDEMPSSSSDASSTSDDSSSIHGAVVGGRSAGGGTTRSAGAGSESASDLVVLATPKSSTSSSSSLSYINEHQAAASAYSHRYPIILLLSIMILIY